MRKGLIAVGASVLLGIAGSAMADTPNTGSHEEDCDAQGNCTYDNEVTCSSDAPLAEAGTIGVYGASNANGDGGTLEACDDSGAVQGRIILSGGMSEGGGFIAADGDGSNDENARGWIRVDGNSSGATVSCGDSAGNLDSTHPTPDDTQDDCAPGS